MKWFREHKTSMIFSWFRDSFRTTAISETPPINDCAWSNLHWSGWALILKKKRAAERWSEQNMLVHILNSHPEFCHYSFPQFQWKINIKTAYSLTVGMPNMQCCCSPVLCLCLQYCCPFGPWACKQPLNKGDEGKKQWDWHYAQAAERKCNIYLKR